LEIIKREVHARLEGAESEVVVNERTKILLEDVARELQTAISDHGAGHEIFAEHVRAASDKIGQALGIIGAEEIMDSVFGQLCLGK
jgi:tRNA U34 5-carboxymethylaminomethyl modifying GTPase MnmE/TrmE